VSQQNAVIDRPFIRPRPCAYLGKNYYLYDNFADNKYENRVGVAANGFRYQDWTVQTGTWTAANGYLEKTAVLNTDQYISIPSTHNVGTWSIRARSTEQVGNAYSRLFFMNNEPSQSATSDGYYVHLSWELDPHHFQLAKAVNNVHTLLIDPPDVAYDAGWHEHKITRDAAGNFELFYDGVSTGVVNDGAVTTSDYIVIMGRRLLQNYDDLKVH